jgi:hypothetical protein
MKITAKDVLSTNNRINFTIIGSFEDLKKVEALFEQFNLSPITFKGDSFIKRDTKSPYDSSCWIGIVKFYGSEYEWYWFTGSRASIPNSVSAKALIKSFKKQYPEAYQSAFPEEKSSNGYFVAFLKGLLSGIVLVISGVWHIESWRFWACAIILTIAANLSDIVNLIKNK